MNLTTTRRGRTIAVSIFDTFFLFGLIVFLYVVGVSYWQPQWLGGQVTHLQEGIWWLSWLRNDIMGVIAFAVSALSYFASRYIRNSN